MRSEKLSTKDWKSSKLGIIQSFRPKIRDKVDCKCYKCNCVVSIIFRDLLKSTNKQLAIGLDSYHCKMCLRESREFRDMHRSNSVAAIEKITVGASNRSKLLWTEEGYRSKLQRHHENLKNNVQFSERVSKSISSKFKDPEYLKKVTEARRQYWKKREYKESKSWDKAKFISESRLVHGDSYKYDLTDYQNFKSKVTIECPKHGPFQQRPSHHILYENGCPKCVTIESRQQAEIAEWLSSYGFDVITNDRKILGGLELDVVIGNKLAIEYNGCYWHSYNKQESTFQRHKHYRKCDLAIENGIQLFQITDIEWNDRNNIVKSMILQRLGISERMHARKCEFTRLNSKDAEAFFDSNHISGNRPAHDYYGLILNGQIVSAISFMTHADTHEIIRFCSATGTTVVGGLSKMLTNAGFISGVKLFTYADRRYSTAVGYKSCGFELTSITRPGYQYWKNNQLFSRLKFQKHKLHKLLEHFDPDKSESENMFSNGYRRLWDAGHFKLTMK